MNTSFQDLLDANILVVDDEPGNVILLDRVLRGAGYSSIRCLTESSKVEEACAAQWPDLVLLDIMMPVMDGFGVLEVLRQMQFEDDFLPVLILTADVTSATRRKALAEGAMDFVTKPFDHAEVLLRVRNLLVNRFLYRQLRAQKSQLEEKVLERTRELESTQIEVLERLAQAAEFRDDDTGIHTRRVGELAGQLAAELGLAETFIARLRQTAPLHDVGKIAIPDHILLKPGPLTPDEFEVMKTHTTLGASLLRDGRSQFILMAETIALTHHERWNGMGYPSGLIGKAIPMEGRIVSVVDVFDALTNERPYKKAWSREEAVREIEGQAGKQFDPEVVSAFTRVIRRSLQY